MGEQVSGRFDIRAHKTELRNKYKKMRREMPADIKKKRDHSIFSKLVSMDVYKNCKTILTYVSTEIEVDTFELIKQALKDGKTVAVPRCVDGTRDMIFYIIRHMSDLETGSFSVLEPVPEKCKELKSFDGALCIVPALVYDSMGFRLGYGKGYYDRFLSAHPDMFRVGIAYCSCIVTELIHGRFDIPVNLIVTEKYVKKCEMKEVK